MGKEFSCFFRCFLTIISSSSAAGIPSTCPAFCRPSEVPVFSLGKGKDGVMVWGLVRMA